MSGGPRAKETRPTRPTGPAARPHHYPGMARLSLYAVILFFQVLASAPLVQDHYGAPGAAGAGGPLGRAFAAAVAALGGAGPKGSTSHAPVYNPSPLLAAVCKVAPQFKVKERGEERGRGQPGPALCGGPGRPARRPARDALLAVAGHRTASRLLGSSAGSAFATAPGRRRPPAPARSFQSLLSFLTPLSLLLSSLLSLYRAASSRTRTSCCAFCWTAPSSGCR